MKKKILFSLCLFALLPSLVKLNAQESKVVIRDFSGHIPDTILQIQTPDGIKSSKGYLPKLVGDVYSAFHTYRYGYKDLNITSAEPPIVLVDGEGKRLRLLQKNELEAIDQDSIESITVVYGSTTEAAYHGAIALTGIIKIQLRKED